MATPQFIPNLSRSSSNESITSTEDLALILKVHVLEEDLQANVAHWFKTLKDNSLRTKTAVALYDEKQWKHLGLPAVVVNGLRDWAAPQGWPLSVVLNVPLPKFNFNLSGSNSTTEPLGDSRPKTLLDWRDFRSKVEDFLASLPDIVSVKFSFQTDFKADPSYEETAVDLLKLNIGQNLNKVLSNIVFMKPRTVKGSPDYACMIEQNNRFDPLIMIEVKHPRILKFASQGPWILHETYKSGAQSIPGKRNQYGMQTNCVLSSVNQLWVYMKMNQRTYGILTTYESTWFMRRDPQDNLFVSEVIKYDAKSPTALACFYYFVQLAFNDNKGKSNSPENSPTKNQDDSMEL